MSFINTEGIWGSVRDTVQDTLIMKYKVNVEVLPRLWEKDEVINNLEIIYSDFTDVEVVQNRTKRTSR
jgi:DNA-directed RNA polymerase subunit H (RpoH/RPB5)